VENGTTSDNSHSGRSSICNDITSPSTPSGIFQEEYQPIINDPTSGVRNKPIIHNSYKYSIAQETTAKEQTWECFQNHELNFCPNLFEDAGECVDSPEFTARKIKAAVIANKKAVEFQKTLNARATSDDKDLDDSSLLNLFNKLIRLTKRLEK